MQQKWKHWRLFSGSVFAALGTFLIFLPAMNNKFVELDDFGYIVDNRHIDTLDWQTVVWAFTQFHEANWHPLTMLSLALDRRIWGLTPSGFHLTNVIIHSCTVFCVCFLFASLLKVASLNGPSTETWNPCNLPVTVGSIAGALLFGLHPLRVESVVWASERKDVLCLFFTVAALWCYLRYAEQRSVRPLEHFASFGTYWSVLFMACLALLSKPTAVSLPLVLLIVDWYPLARITDRHSFLGAVKEKVPLFLMTCGAGILTVVAQNYAIIQAPVVGASSRLLVACKALIFYLWKILWPAGLSPIYPHPGNVIESAPLEYLLYASVLATICITATLLGRRLRIWPALWLYYLVTLAPMLGIIQVGGQWIADRYTYLPALGISLLWGGGGAWLVGRLRQKGHAGLAMFLIGVAVCQLVSYAGLTLRTIPYWRNTETIATRVIDIMPRQVGAAYYARAKYRNEKGEYGRALEDVDAAMSIALRRASKSRYAELSMTQSKILRNLGRLPEALAAADWAIQTSVVEPPVEYIEFRNELAQNLADNPSLPQLQ